MNNKEMKSEFYLFDAKGKILGRLATEIAQVLSGKKRIDYTPNIGGKDWVIVINSDKVRLSGEKSGKKIYWRYSGYPGGIYKKTFEEMIEDDSRKVIEKAVRGMIPRNKLGKASLKRLRIFKDDQHPYEDKIKKLEK
jgi:large subunit ribosomal protein L13